jgi:hypothetical protein
MQCRRELLDLAAGELGVAARLPRGREHATGRVPRKIGGTRRTIRGIRVKSLKISHLTLPELDFMLPPFYAIRFVLQMFLHGLCNLR